jgi:hypothetical protein
VFIDPYGEVYPCNALAESMGNVKNVSFEEIWNGAKAKQAREMVSGCPKNCWMVGTSRPAIKKNLWKPTQWVLKNKLRLLLGKDIVWNIENGQNIENEKREEVLEKEEQRYQVIHT